MVQSLLSFAETEEQISNTLDNIFCINALEEALKLSQPEIFNTDQGVQFTSRSFTEHLESADVKISMDGRGRVFDNIFIERLWRTVKYEDIYLKNYDTVTSVANTFGFGELSQVYEAKSSPRKFDRKIAGYALMRWSEVYV